MWTRNSYQQISNIDSDDPNIDIDVPKLSSIANDHLNIKSEIDKLDSIYYNKYYIFDIIVCALWIASVISTVLCSMSLYHENVVLFYRMIATIILGILFNIFAGVILAAQHVREKYPHNAVKEAFWFFMYTLLFTILGPITSIWKFHTHITPSNYYSVPTLQFKHFIGYAILTAFPQSLIFCVAIAHDRDDNYNIYIISSLVANILICLLTFIFISQQLTFPYQKLLRFSFSAIKHKYSLVLGSYCLILDYLLLLSLITTSSTHFIFYLFLCNEIPTVLFSITHAYSIIATKPINCCCSIPIYLATVVKECCLFIPSVSLWIYIWYEKVENKLDSNLLRWICNGNDCIKRLCIANGLVIDANNHKQRHKNAEFACVFDNNDQMNADQELKSGLFRYTISNNSNCNLFGWNEWLRIHDLHLRHMHQNGSLMWKTCHASMCLYIVSRANKLIFFPIIISVYFTIYNEWNVLVRTATFIQFIFVAFGFLLLRPVWRDVSHSYAMVSDDCVSPKKIQKWIRIRQNIGFCSSPMLVYQLYDELLKYFPSDVFNLIIEFAKTISREQWVENENIILNNALKLVQEQNGNAEGLTKDEFHYFLSLLPRKYSKKLNAQFDDFVNYVLCCDIRNYIAHIISE